MKTNRLMAALPLMLLLAFGAATESQAGKSDDTLNFADAEELVAIDTYFNSDRIGIIMARLVWDTLFYRDPKTGAYQPMLAIGYKWVDDRTLDVELRQGVKFHNGDAFGADDVAGTFNYAIDPATKVKVRNNVSWMKQVEKLGPYKVRIHLVAPFPAALEYLSGPLPIYPFKYYQSVGKAGFEAKPVGSGPYKIQKIEAGKRVELVRNDDYFKGSPAPKPSIGKIVFRSIPDENTQVAELMAGSLDWVWKVKKDQGEALKANPKLTVVGAPTMRVGYLHLNVAGKGGMKSPIQDVKVRQAIAYAINRESIVTNMMGEGGMVPHAACYISQFGCTYDVPRYAYNPAKAKQLLADAGYPNGFDIVLDGYRDRELLEAIIGDLAKVGIKVTLAMAKYAAVRDQVRAGKSAMAMMAWGSFSMHDTSAFTSNFFRGKEDDTVGDERVAEWLKVADTSVDEAKRKEHYKMALGRIAEQAYFLPLWAYPYTYAYSRDLIFNPTPDEIPRFGAARWK